MELHKATQCLPNIRRTSEILENHPSPLFRGEKGFPSNHSKSCGLDPDKINYADIETKLNDGNLVKRHYKIITTEINLKIFCNNQFVEYILFGPGESYYCTQTRRNKLNKMCHSVAQNMTKYQAE